MNIVIWEGKQLPVLKPKKKAHPVTSFCRVSVVGKPYMTYCTPGHPGPDPKYEHAFDLLGLVPEDALEFDFFHAIPDVGEELLGSFVIKWEEFMAGPFDEFVVLTTPKPPKKGTSPQVKVSVDLMDPEINEFGRRFFVRVVNAENLHYVAGPGSSPSSCVLVELKDKPETKWSTFIVRDDPNPNYDEEGELYGYEENDALEVQVLGFDANGEQLTYGQHTFSAEDLAAIKPDPGKKMQAEVKVQLNDEETSLRLILGMVEPKPVEIDPGAHVTEDDRGPVPFILRSLDHGRTHRLLGYTRVGRSRTQCDPEHDLVLDEPPVSMDVRRWHATIKVWEDGDSASGWRLRVYTGPKKGPSTGVDIHTWRGEETRPHEMQFDDPAYDAGTRIDDEPVHIRLGTEIISGHTLRFGFTELWVVESSALFPASSALAREEARARTEGMEDPNLMRELRIGSVVCYQDVAHCKSWFDLIRVVLEYLQEPDEPPCADMIEVKDECGKLVSRHEIVTIEEFQDYPVAEILREVRIGASLRIRLSSDPVLLASTIELQDELEEELYNALQNRIPLG